MVKEIEKKEVIKEVKKKVNRDVKIDVKKEVNKEVRGDVEVEIKNKIEKEVSGDSKEEVRKKAKRVVNKKITDKYYESQGRRKTSVARVRIWFGRDKSEFVINKKPLNKYFPSLVLQETSKAPLKEAGLEDSLKISVIVKGGGLFGQAVAVRHGITRALVDFNPELRKRLKKIGFLTRDPRMRERKKFGLKRARKSPRWSKR